MPARGFLTSKSESTYLRVIDSAIKLFQAKGFEATSMRDISKESGLALGALYYYCRSKEELVFMFYDRITDQVSASYERRETSARSLGDAFVEFMQLKMSKLSKFRKLLVVVLKESFDPESAISPLNKASAPFREKNIQIFSDMAGRFGSKDAKEAGQILWLVHMLVLAYWLYDRSEKYEATQRLLRTTSTCIGAMGLLSHVPGWSQIVQQIKSVISAILAVD